ncbi:MAG: hypothetical protein H0T76_15950 [Nannocystis sp.]|nr:hypothetical protein [Nannocystis sp.]MBA3547977.1 hypothetical protein [Nannocystis sp.]
MRLTPAQYDQYYASLGIQRSDLRSAEVLTLAELPRDVTLSEVDRTYVLGILEQWNGIEDPRMRVDAAGAMERRVLQGRHPDQRQSGAWAAFLMLGRVRDCEARRETMHRIALGELVPEPPRPRKPRAPARTSAARGK